MLNAESDFVNHPKEMPVIENISYDTKIVIDDISEENYVVFESASKDGIAVDKAEEGTSSSDLSELLTKQFKESRESLSVENLIFKPVQQAFHLAFTLCIQALIVLIILRLSVEVARKLFNGSKKKWVQYLSYDKESYKQTKMIIHYFKEYKQFKLKMYLFASASRWKYGKEIAALFEEINRSPYKKESMYQYELIRFFPSIKALRKLLKQHKSSELIQQIETFNQNYWHVEF